MATYTLTPGAPTVTLDTVLQTNYAIVVDGNFAGGSVVLETAAADAPTDFSILHQGVWGSLHTIYTADGTKLKATLKGAGAGASVKVKFN